MAEPKLKDEDESPGMPAVSIDDTKEVVIDPKTGDIVPQEADEEDESPGMSQDDDDFTVVAPTNREKRQARNARRRETANHKDRVIVDQARAIAQLEERLARTEGRLSSHDLFAIDGRITTTKASRQAASESLAAAVDRGDGKAAAEAQSWLNNVDSHLRELATLRSRVENDMKTSGTPRGNGSAAPGADQPQQQVQIDPAVARNLNAWAEKNTWYNPNGNDADSVLVRSIDHKMWEEGWDPKDRAYWRELTRRVKAVFPEHSPEDVDDSAPPPRNGQDRGPPVGGRSEGRPNGQKFVLSRERIQAMKDANIWEDPVKRKRTIQRYIQHDAEARRARNAV